MLVDEGALEGHEIVRPKMQLLLDFVDFEVEVLLLQLVAEVTLKFDLKLLAVNKNLLKFLILYDLSHHLSVDPQTGLRTRNLAVVRIADFDFVYC